MGKITVETCEIEGLKIITPTVFGDARGYFMETYNYNDFKAAGIPEVFVQDNQSASKKGVLRGLHFQKHFPQDKLVRVIRGEVSPRLKWICGKVPPVSASGTECFCLKRTRSSSLSRRILHMVFWYCRIMRNSAINVRISIIPMMRAVLLTIHRISV